MSPLERVIIEFLHRKGWISGPAVEFKGDPKAEREGSQYILVFLGLLLVPLLIMSAIFLAQHLRRQLVPVVSLQPLCVVLAYEDLENPRVGHYVPCDRAEAAVAEAASRRGAEHIVVAEAARATILVVIDGTAYDRAVFIHGADLDMARSKDALWINPVHRKTQKIVVANDWSRVLAPFFWLRGPLFWVIGACAVIWGFGKLRAVRDGRAGAE